MDFYNSLFTGSRTGSDTVPTAHVQPTTSSRNAPLRATQKFGWDEPKRAASPDIFQGGAAKTDDHNKLMDNMKNKRWGSLGNLQLDTFQEIPVDTDPTFVDENRFNDPAAHVLYKDKEYRSSNPDLTNQGYVPQTRTQEMFINRPSSVPPDMPYNAINHGLRDQNPVPGIESDMTSTYLQTYSNIPRHMNGGYSMNRQSSMSGQANTDYGLPSSNVGVATMSEALPYREHYTGDITQWQQRHQEQLKRQQLETSQVGKYGLHHVHH